jgi:hypothetical protein
MRDLAPSNHVSMHVCVLSAKMYVGRYFTERGEFDEVCFHCLCIALNVQMRLNRILGFSDLSRTVGGIHHGRNDRHRSLSCRSLPGDRVQPRKRILHFDH